MLFKEHLVFFFIFNKNENVRSLDFHQNEMRNKIDHSVMRQFAKLLLFLPSWNILQYEIIQTKIKSFDF